MLLNLKKFDNNKVFDENFFLYFEEFDLCNTLIKNKVKNFTTKIKDKSFRI